MNITIYLNQKDLLNKMAKEIFGANLKMNKVCPGVKDLGSDNASPSEQATINLIKSYIAEGIRGSEDKEVVVFAPDIFLSALSKLDSLKGIKLGAQRTSISSEGPHTAETSPVWYNNLGVTDVLVGHSEIRKHYEEIVKLFTDSKYAPETIDNFFMHEVETAHTHNLRVTYCVGETKDERESGKTESVLEKQIETGLGGIQLTGLNRVIFAYEPVWAISDGITPAPTPTKSQIEEAHAIIRDVINKMGHSNSAESIVLYGGSMNPNNVDELMKIPGVNGGLIGGASLDAKKFEKIVNYQTSQEKEDWDSDDYHLVI